MTASGSTTITLVFGSVLQPVRTIVAVQATDANNFVVFFTYFLHETKKDSGVLDTGQHARVSVLPCQRRGMRAPAYKTLSMGAFKSMKKMNYEKKTTTKSFPVRLHLFSRSASCTGKQWLFPPCLKRLSFSVWERAKRQTELFAARRFWSYQQFCRPYTCF